MENTAPGVIIENCAYCNTTSQPDDVFCTNCGYPLKGTEAEQKTFIAEKEYVQIDLDSYNKTLKSASTSLYYLAGVFVFSGLVNYFLYRNTTDVTDVVVSNAVLAVIFLILGIFSKKKPLACNVCGLSLYIIVQVLNAISNPLSIAQGIIIKIVIIGYMIKGIKSAIEIEKIKKENNLV